jgi:REP element-mobilizing transposase RayT
VILVQLEKPSRKHPRLKGYDYGQNGAYFVTICTYEKQEILSNIQVGRGLAPAANRLTLYGKIAEEELLKLESRYPNVTISTYVIMPNHIHILIQLQETTGAAGASPRPTVQDIICSFKSLTVRRCKQMGDIDRVFQDSFHDHIIRNEEEYQSVWQYIEGNPEKWTDDCFYPREHQSKKALPQFSANCYFETAPLHL